jgi:hypothetical protein
MASGRNGPRHASLLSVRGMGVTALFQASVIAAAGEKRARQPEAP